MASRQKDTMLQTTAYQLTHPSQDSRTPASCSDPSATLDLAALSEGNLSKEGLQRLACHVLRCPTCKATLASLVTDARRSAAEDRAIYQKRIARLLRAVGLEAVSRAFKAPTAMRARARPAKPVVHRDFDASGPGSANGSRNGRRACAGCQDE